MKHHTIFIATICLFVPWLLGVGSGGITCANAAPLVADSPATTVTSADEYISTTAPSGHAAYAYNSGTIIVTGGTLETAGANAHAAFAHSGGQISLTGGEAVTAGASSSALNASGAGSLIAAVNLRISTTGANSHGAYAVGGATITLDNSQVTTHYDSASGSDGAYSASADGVNTKIYVLNHSALLTLGGHRAYGAIAQNGGEIIIDNSSSQATGTYAPAAWANGTGTITVRNSSTLISTGYGASGLQANSGGRASIDASTVITDGVGNIGIHTNGAGAFIEANNTVITTAAASSAGVNAMNQGAISITGVVISTTGANSHGAAVADAGSTLTLGAGNRITTHGAGAHGLGAYNGASLSITTLGTLPDITVHGAGAAALYASGNATTTSIITLSSNALTIAATPDYYTILDLASTTVGAKADYNSRIVFADNSNTGGTALWATDSGTIAFSGANTDAAGSRVRIDVNSTLDISGITGTNLNIGSLEGAGFINLGARALTIGVDNAGGDGTLRAGSAFAGAITGAGGTLVKTGAGTLTLSGTNTHTGGITLGVGTLIAATAENAGLALGAGAFTFAADSLLHFAGSGTLASRLIVAANTSGTLAAAPGKSLVVTTAATGLNGGAVHLNPGATYTSLGDITYADNRGGSGGAIFAAGGATLAFDKNTFVRNTAASNGGAIRFDGQGTITGDLILNSNTAAYGGAISASGSYLDIAGSITADGNRVSNYGGAIHFSGANTTAVRFTGASGTITLSNNYAGEWGGGVLAADHGGAIFDGAAVMTSNTSQKGGGAVSTNGDVRFTSTTAAIILHNNTQDNGAAGILDDGGGAIRSHGVSLFAGDAELTGNKAMQGFGGAVGAYGSFASGYGTGNDILFTGTHATVLVSGNYAKNFGGGLAARIGNVSIAALNLILDANTTGSTGGAIHAATDILVTNPDATILITSNTAEGSGGALYAGRNVSIAAGARFENNYAAGSGGAIYATGGSIATGGTFTGNYAGSAGGAISITNGQLTAAGNVFISNTSVWSGGALYAITATVDLTSGTFTGNHSRYGGAIGAQSAVIDISRSLVSSNTSTESGGAISLSRGVTLTAIDTDFLDNTSINGFGGVFDAYADNAPVTLNLGATAGKTSTISGNTDSLGANSINLCGENSALAITLNITTGAGGVLAMLDPIRTEALANGFIFSATKTGAGEWRLGGSSTIAGTGGNNITIREGALTLLAGGTLDLSSNATDTFALAPAGTLNTLAGAQLLTGIYDQTAGTLHVAISPAEQPAVLAATATIGATGTLNVTNFIGTATVAKASDLADSTHTFLRTTGGISGTYAAASVLINGDAVETSPDYILGGAFKSLDNLDYNIGYALRWFTGTATAHGTFTLDNAADTFDVDVSLTDQNALGTFASGWDGISLTKDGAGTLTLSAINTHTGTTRVSGGTLSLAAANAIATGTAVVIGQNATLALAADQLLQNISGDGLITLGTSALTAHNTTDTVFSGTLDGAAQPSLGLAKTGPATLLDMSGATTVISTTAAGIRAVVVYSGTLALGNARLESAQNTAAIASGLGNTLIIASSTVTARGENTGFTGFNGAGFYAVSMGSIFADAVRINTTGSWGHGLLTNGGGYGNTFVPYISLANGSEVVTTGYGAAGAFLFGSHALISIADSSITTHGDTAHGAYAFHASQFQARDSTITTFGYGAAGIAAEGGGSAKIYDTAITTFGGTAAGLLAYGIPSGTSPSTGQPWSWTSDYHITAENVTITTDSHNSDGARADARLTIYASQQGAGSIGFTGSNTITTSGNNSHGLAAAGVYSGSASKITAFNNALFDITTHGANSHGASATNGGIIDLAGSDGVKITTAGASAFALHAIGAGSLIDAANLAVSTTGASAHAIYSDYGARIDITGTANTISTTGYIAHALFLDNANATINAANTTISTGDYLSFGVIVRNSGGVITLTGTTSVSTLGAESGALYTKTGTITATGSVFLDTRGYNAVGVEADYGSLVDLRAASRIITAGDAAHGFFAVGGNARITATNAVIETHGDGAYGAFIHSGGQITFGASSTITTTGDEAHGIRADAGSTVIFDDTANPLPRITVSGSDSAAINASANGSRVTLTGTQSLAVSMTPGAHTLGAKAENNAVIEFAANSVTGGTRLRATNSGTLLFTGADTAAAGSHVTLDDNGVLDFATITTGSFAVGSLEGDATAFVELGANDLASGINNTAANGTLLTTSTYAGRITGGGALAIASNTLALTGANDYAGGTQIMAGAARLIITTGSAIGTGTITANGVFETAFAASDTLANTIAGSGTLENTGALATLTATNSAIGAVNVLSGKLHHAQTGTFRVAGDYNVAATGTAALADASRLNIAGAYNQLGALTLAIGTGSANNPGITAATATLGAASTLDITNYIGTAAGLAQASLLNGTFYTVIHTTSGITGDFSSVLLNGGALPAASYSFISGGAYKTADALDYIVGYQLAWYTGTASAHGAFDLPLATDAFEVDIPLNDQNHLGAFASGWDGRSLTKNGLGTLTLSASNSYSGATLVNAGTLALTADHALGNTARLDIRDGATALITGGSQNAGYVTTSTGATLRMTGGTLIGATTSTWILNGLIDVRANSRIETSSVVLVGNASGDIGSVFVSGSAALASNSNLHIGYNGTGTLAISEKAVVTANRTDVGMSAGSNGTLEITGSGYTSNNTELVIGHTGNGALRITDSGSARGASAYIGYIGTGTVYMDDNALWRTDGAMFIADSGGTAAITLTGSSRLESGGASTSSSANALTTIDIGENAFWQAGSLILGRVGRATLTITDSGSIATTTAGLGNNIGSYGAAALSDNSRWDADSVTIAGSGTGVLTLTDNARITSNSAGIGSGATGTGSVSLSADAAWNNVSTIVVGQSGLGTLDLADRAILTNGGRIDVGTGASGTGTIKIGGSAYLDTESLAVANGKHGDLIITQSGSVRSASSYIGYTAASTGAIIVNDDGAIQLGSLDISNNGSGTLALNDRATATASSIRLGNGRGDVVLNGGLLLANGITAVAAGTNTITFNSGTLRPVVDNAAFFSGFGGANNALSIAAGGAYIDTFGRNIGTDSASGFTGAGALHKLGSGTLTLNAAGDYTGGTEIREGALVMTNAAAISTGSAHIAQDAALIVDLAPATGTLTFANLLTGDGLLAARLATRADVFSFSPSAFSPSAFFTGTLGMFRGHIDLDAVNTAALARATLVLDPFGSADIASTGTIAALVMNGGNLGVQFDEHTTHVSNTLTVGRLHYTGGTIATNLTGIVTPAISDLENFFNYSIDAGRKQEQLVTVLPTGTVTAGLGTLVHATTAGGVDINTTGSAVIIREGAFDTGTAFFSGQARVYADGIWMGFGLSKIYANNGAQVRLDNIGSAGDDIDAQLTGPGGFHISGTGLAIFNNASNDYTGATLITGTHLVVTASSNNILGRTTALTTGSLTTLDLNNNAQTINGAVDLAATSTIALRATGSLAILAGGTSRAALTGGPDATLTAGGLLDIRGANTALAATINITGTTTIHDIAGIGNTGTAHIAPNAMLVADAVTGTFTKTLAAAGAFQLANTSAITLGADNSTFTGTFDITAASRLVAETNAHLGHATAGANITGAGVFEKQNAATAITIAHANTGFTGTTLVTAGTLSLTAGSALGNTALIEIRPDAVMIVSTGSQYAGYVNTHSGGTLLMTGGTLATPATGGWRINGLVDATTGASRMEYGSNLAVAGTGTTGQFLIGGTSVLAGNGSAYIGDTAGSHGRIIVTDYGSILDTGNTYYVGNNGAGILSLADNATATGFGAVYIGSNTGTGSLTLSDKSSLSTNAFTLGYGGPTTGTLAMTGAAHLKTGAADGNTIIASDGGAQGGALLSGTSVWEIGGAFIVANNGTATLDITESATVSVTANSIFIGRYGNADGRVTVSGTAARLNSVVQIIVGENATGRLNINDGALATANRTDIGSNGTGTLNITASGTMNAGQIFYVGTGATGFGTVNISGTSSLLTTATATGYTSIADLGIAVINITDGGRADINNTAFIGNNLGSTGTINVTGDGSQLHFAERALFGNAGNGTLNMTSGATVTARDLVLGWSNGAGAVNLDGGLLGVADTLAANNSLATFRFNSGTLRATGTAPLSITAGFNTGSRLLIENGGAYLDTNAIGINAASGFTGSGALHKLGSGTLALNAASNYTGGTEVRAGTLLMTHAAAISTGTARIAQDAELRVATAAITFSNTLSGAGLFTVDLNNASNVFAFSPQPFSSSALFSGTARFLKSTYTLTGSAWQNATFTSATGNHTIVGTGTNPIRDLVIDGGRIDFDTNVPADTASPAFIAATGSIQLVSGTVAIRIPQGDTTYTVPQTPLLQHDEGALTKLASSATTVGALNLVKLYDLNTGALVSATQTSAISQSGTQVATGTYGYGLSASDANGDNGLYVSYGLVAVDILADRTLLLTSDTNTPAGGAEFHATITGSGNLALEAAKSIQLNATNAYTGTTLITSGTIIAGAADALGKTAYLSVTNTAAYNLQHHTQTIANGATIDGSLAGSGSLGLGGIATITSTNADFTANIGVTGTTIINNTAALGDSGTLHIASGASVKSVGTSGTFTKTLDGFGNFTLADSSTITLDANNTNYSGTFVITATSHLAASTNQNLGNAALSGEGVFEKSNDTTTITIARANETFTGTALITGGTLRLENLGGLGSSAVNNTAALDLAATGTFSNNITGSGTTAVTGSGVNLTGTNQTTWHITGAAQVSSTANLGAGNTHINGQLVARAASPWVWSNTLTGTGTLLIDTTAFDFTDTTGTTFLGTVELHTAAFDLAGDNTTALTNATLQLADNAHTTVGDGTQQIGNLTLASGTITFTLGSSGTAASGIVKTNTLTVRDTIVRIDTTAFTAGDLPLLQQDEGAQIKLIDSVERGAGSVTLITGTQLVDQNGAQLGNATQRDITQNAVVTASGTYDFAATVTGSGLHLGYTLTALDLLAGQTTALSGDIDDSILRGADELHARVTGSGNLAINATSHIILNNAANTYTGTTLINTGTLIAGANNALGNTAYLHVSDTAAFNLNDTEQTIRNGGLVLAADGLQGTGILNLSGGLLDIRAANTDFAALINNTGTIQLAHVQSLGDTSTVSLNNADATLILNPTTSGTFNTGVTGHGRLIKDGAATVTITRANDYSGSTEIRDGTLAAAHIAALGNSAVTVAANATFEQRDIANGTLQNALSGAGTHRITNSTLTLADAASYTIANTTLDHASTLRLGVTGIQFGALDMNNGALIFETATGAARIDTLGDTPGNITMNVNFGATHPGINTAVSNYLSIENGGNATHNLTINPAGQPAHANIAIELIGITSGTPDFVLANPGGKFEYGMSAIELVRGDGTPYTPDTNIWYLSDSALSHAADAIINTASTLPLDWASSLDALHLRMGDIRAENLNGPGNPKSGNIWMRTRGYRLNAANGLSGMSFKQYGWGVTGGVDKTFEPETGVHLIGGFIDMGNVDRRFDNDGNGKTRNIAIGAYLTLLKQNGWHLDAIARLDRYSNDFEAKAVNGRATRGNYTTESQSLSFEAGRRLQRSDGWWLEPGLQVAILCLDSANYSTHATADQREIDVHVDKSETWQYRALVRFGKQIPNSRWSPYGKFAAVSVDSSGGEITAYGKQFAANHDGRRIELGLGTSYRIDDISQIYIDYEYAKAALYDRPWSLNLGYRRLW